MPSASSLALAAAPLARVDADDEAPVSEVAVSSATRFRFMIDQNYDFIWRSIRRLGVAERNVDDAVQHVFWVASQKIDQIEVGSERSFLFRTAAGVAANERRSATNRRHQVCDVNDLALHADASPDPEELMRIKHARAQLDLVIGAMDPELGSVFVLFELEGMTGAEIAKVLEIAPGTVASRLRRAREFFEDAVSRMHAKAVTP
jgi:RNA polymerase sigma-70 factor, ECF subfamily